MTYNFTKADINDFVTIAQNQYDGLKATTIVLPYGTRNKVRVYLKDDNPFFRDRANIVQIDPEKNRYSISKNQTIWGAMSFYASADPLHFGNFWGLYSK